MGIENNISTMTIPVVSPDNSRHFASLGEILQQQKLTVSSFELENHLLSFYFLALVLAVISWVIDISFCSIAGLKLDRNVIALEWYLTSDSSILYHQDTVTKKMPVRIWIYS